MKEERKMICDRCRGAVPIKEMRYLPKGKEERMALCGKCREELSKPLPDKKESARTYYFCIRCNYKFKQGTQFDTNLKCPFCGKGDKIADYGQLSSNESFYDKVL